MESMNSRAIVVVVILLSLTIGLEAAAPPYLVKKTTTSPKPTVAALESNLTTVAITELPTTELIKTSQPEVTTSSKPLILETTTEKLIVETTSKPVAIVETTLKPVEIVETTTVSKPVAIVETTVSGPSVVEISTPSVAPIVETSPIILPETTAAPTIAPIELTSEIQPPEPTKIQTAEPIAPSTSTPVAIEQSTPEQPLFTPTAEVPVHPVHTLPPGQTLPPVDFDCSKKSDGFYADPKDKCSPIFYACVSGLARRLECGAGGLVYEPDSGTCERRHESFRCTGTRKTTMPTTPRRPPPPPASLVLDCTKLDDGWYADPQKKCSNAFYSCANGIASRFDCPGKMYFDVDTIACQPFQDVMACSGKKPTSKKFVATSPMPQEKLPIDCLNLASGSYPDPSKKCSNIFYVCSNGDGFKRECPKGLFYDEKKVLCDFFEEIFACSGRVKPPTKPTPAPKPSPASLPSKEFNCSSKKDGSYLPESQKCSNYYFRCVGGISYKLTCPAGLFYDLENDLCDRFMNVFVCSGKKQSPKPITTKKPTPTEKLPIDCSKLSDGDYPDPEKKCSSTYFTCSNYLGSRRSCPRGTYFDKNSRLCDSREYVIDCGGKSRPATKPTTKRPIPSVPFNCEKLTDGNYVAGKCMSKYYACVGGIAVESNCPNGTYYDKELDQCGYKEQIPECGGVRPTKPTKKPSS